MLSLLVLLMLSFAAALPTIFWVSEPIYSNHLVSIAIAGQPLTNHSQVQISQPSSPWINVSTQGITAYGCAALIPDTWPDGELLMRVDGGMPFLANVARPWFVFGDLGDSASPGGWLRIVGVGVARGSRSAHASAASVPILRLTRFSGDSLPILLPARASDSGDGQGAKLTRWHAFFDVPEQLTPGNYNVAVGQSEASTFTDLCTFVDEDTPCLSAVSVRIPQMWKPTVFDVSKMSSSVLPVPGFDHTPAIAEALSQAGLNGGGIVYFPRGQYFIRGAIILPANTELRGEARDLVSLYFAEDDAHTAPDAYVTGTKSSSWGMRAVTLYVTAFAHNIVRFQPGTDGAFLVDTRIRYNSHFCLEANETLASRGRSAPWLRDAGTAVMLAGKNLFVTDNDIFSSGDVVSTLENGAPGSTYMHIARNVFWNGATTHWGISWKQCIYEDNVATGVSVTAMGSNYAQYSHQDGKPHVQNIYHHNNSQTMVWGNDREMMTCDGGGGVYYGGATTDTGNGTHITLGAAAIGEQPGGALCVLEGTQTGDCRRILYGGSAGSTNKFVLNKAFHVPLDASSRVTIMPYVGKVAFVGNSYADGGEIQLYAQALDCIVAENTFERTGGLTAWGRGVGGGRGWNVNFRNQLLDNEVLEGNHVWNYATRPTVEEDPSSYPYFPGGSKTIEPWFFGSMTNDQGPPIDPSPPGDFQGALTRFIVMRGNVVRSGGGVVVRGTSANVLVDSNIIRNSYVGVHVNYSTTLGGVVLHNNQEPPDVLPNFTPYAH